MRVVRVGYLISGLVSLALILYILNLIHPYYQTPTEVVLVTYDVIYLPLPKKVSNVSVEEAILWRRSVRDYTKDPIRLEDLSMILWATYGVTEPTWGFRATPSAGATYPLEIYLVVGEEGVLIDGNAYLVAGVYKYDGRKHLLRLVKQGDFREELYVAAIKQEWVRNAPVSIVICAVFERTTSVYGVRGEVRYVPMEVGHAGQNIYLMSTALGYGAVVVGAFIDEDVSKVINAGVNEVPMYIVPIGVPKTPYRTTFKDIENYIIKARGG